MERLAYNKKLQLICPCSGMFFFRVLLLLLLSPEFFISQIADVHLLDSATRWRLLGQKYLLTAEVTAPIKGRKVGRLVWE